MQWVKLFLEITQGSQIAAATNFERGIGKIWTFFMNFYCCKSHLSHLQNTRALRFLNVSLIISNYTQKLLSQIKNRKIVLKNASSV